MLRSSCFMSSWIAATLVLALAVIGAGCSDDTVEPGDGVTPDTTPPALASVTPTAGIHIEVRFTEKVDRETAERRSNYQILRVIAPPLRSTRYSQHSLAPGDTLHCETAALLQDEKTVLLTTSPWMSAGEQYRLAVDGVKDLYGNVMTESEAMDFTGVDTPDTTPPEILDRSPAPNATGVGVKQSIVVTFSEPMLWNTVANAFSWTGPGVTVPFEMDEGAGGAEVIVFTPTTQLAYGTTYTVGFAANTATDWNSNYLAASSWSYTTTSSADVTPPTLISTTPEDGATHVSIDVTLRLEFSEPMDPHSMDDEGIVMTPSPGDGVDTWTDGGRTLVFDPFEPLLEDTTYALFIAQGALSDVAGNPLSGYHSVTFTTRTSLPTGGFSGTIAGDPNSTTASDPEGALVAAFMVDFFTWDFSDHGPAPMGGVELVDQNGAYEFFHLEDATYWPIVVMDSDGDGDVIISSGDAFGMYGVNFTTLAGEPDPDSVVVSGGDTVADVDFALFDPVTIHGVVSYGGTTYEGNLEEYGYHVGVFDTTTFNPLDPIPDYQTYEPRSIVWEPHYTFNYMEHGLAEGTYYVGAFMDVDPFDVDGYNPAVDPAAFHEVGGKMNPVTVEHGYDAWNINIVLQDPGVGVRRTVGRESWGRPKRSGRTVPEELRKAFLSIDRAIEGRPR